MEQIPSGDDSLLDTHHHKEIPSSPASGYPESRPSPSRRLSTRPPTSTSPDHSRRRSKLETPGLTSLRDSLREKDDPYFLALPDASRSKILSNSAPDLNTLPHPPPRAHRRAPRESAANGNGRLLEQLHSSRRHSSLGSVSQSTDVRPSSRRSMKPPFLRRSPTSSGSSSPNYGSDSESEIFDDDSNVGSVVSTRPSSFSSNASFSDTFLRSASSVTLDGKLRKKGSLAPSFSTLDLRRKRDSQILPERDSIELEDCRFLESEYQRFVSMSTASQAPALRRHLLPMFARPSPTPPPSFALLSRKCAILLKFQNTLLSGLGMRPPLAQHERNTFLEAVACICERREWREYASGMYDENNFDINDGSILGGMAAAIERFREHERMGYHCVSIAMECLGKKNFSGAAVEYCGRVLAVAYFYSPGVAVRLTHALNVATPFTARLLDEVCESSTFRDLSAHTAILRPLFPKHLHDLIYSTPQRYHALLMTRPSPSITVDSNLNISFAGEWVHRWRAHNSDVFFCFLRHWHVILSEHLHSATSDLSVASVAATPGYLVIQGHILRMTDSFIHRNSNDVPAHPLPAPHHRTLSQSTLMKRAFERHPNGPLGPPMPVHLAPGNRIQDSIHAMALLMNSGDGRPQGIEKAEKKLAKAVAGVLSAVRKSQATKPPRETMEDDIVTPNTSASEGDSSSTPRTVSTSDMSSLVSSNKSTSSSARRESLPSLHFQQHLVGLFASLFERTIKAAVRRTSVWEGQACFALCDVLERLVPVMDDSLAKVPDALTCLDWSFWSSVVKRLVLQSENSVTQVRAFGFLFNIWERCPSGDLWLLEEETWEKFFCHWSTLVRCYFMNLVCWRVCMSGQSGDRVDSSTILLLKRRLETAQRRNVALIQHAQDHGLPYPILRASSPLPNRRLVVIASSPSTHEYGITFDSIVPATPATAPQIEQEMIEIPKPPSRGSIMTIVSTESIVTKEEKKGFRLSIFKGVFKSKPKKLNPPPPTIEIEPTTPSPPLVRTESLPRHHRLASVSRPRSRKPEVFQFSMEPVSSRLEGKGVKERPIPSPKSIEKWINPGPIPLPRFARELIRSNPSTSHIDVPSDHSRWRYAGRALAEWEIIVKQCDTHLDSLFRRRESIPEETEEDGTVFLGQGSMDPTVVVDRLYIPRMTVELPRFYFTGKVRD